MATLFPSSRTSKLPSQLKTFDPTAQFVAYHWKKHKKEAETQPNNYWTIGS